MKLKKTSKPPKPVYKCSICTAKVGQRQNAIFCDKCENWVHIGCNNLDKNTYSHLKNSNDSEHWYCIKCMAEIIPFVNVDNECLSLLQQGINVDPVENNITFKDERFSNLLDQINSEETNFDCKYYTPSEFNVLNSPCETSTSFFHLNIASIGYHFDELQLLLSLIKRKFDFIGITETKLLKHKPNITPIQLEEYHIEHCPTESSKGGALLYISKKHDYKVRDDLTIYKSKKLESTFVEILTENSKNTIVGCIYRHPDKDPEDFVQNYLSPLIQKLSTESKEKDIFLMGDFNIDLLKHNKGDVSSSFLSTLAEGGFLPSISIPTRITTKSKTLIDNIFFNNFSNDFTSGNFTTSISDHLSQFLIFDQNIAKQETPKYKMQRDYRNFDEQNFIQDISSINWDRELQLNCGNPNFSTESFVSIINKTLNKHAPLKKKRVKKYNTNRKPWITIGILTSFKKRDQLHRKYIKCKNPGKKEALFQDYKRYRNMVNS